MSSMLGFPIDASSEVILSDGIAGLIFKNSAVRTESSDIH